MRLPKHTRTLWRELCCLVSAENTNASMKEAFEAIQADMAQLFKNLDVCQTAAFPQLSDSLRAELVEGLKDGQSAHEIATHREDNRFFAAQKRAIAIREGLQDYISPSRARQFHAAFRRLEDFLIRFHRHRLKQVAYAHLSPELAERIALIVDSTPDFRGLMPLPPKCSAATEEEMVCMLLRRTPPTIRQQDAAVTIFQPLLVCTLRYGTEDEAEAALACIRTRFRISRAGHALRKAPTVSTLRKFLVTVTRDHPPRTISIKRLAPPTFPPED